MAKMLPVIQLLDHYSTPYSGMGITYWNMEHQIQKHKTLHVDK